MAGWRPVEAERCVHATHDPLGPQITKPGLRWGSRLEYAKKRATHHPQTKKLDPACAEYWVWLRSAAT